MKTSIRTWLASCALLLIGSTAQAGPLVMDGDTVPTHLAVSGATLEASMATAFSGSGFSGTLQTYVFSGDVNNSYGGLTFAFVLNNDATSTNALGRLTLNGWTDALAGTIIGAYYDSTLGGTKAPSLATRTAPGVVGFNFFSGGLKAGVSSTGLILQTSADSFQASTASVIDGTTVDGVATFAPAAVPDGGATVALLGIALFGLGTLRRKLS